MTMKYVKAQPLPRVDDPILNKALQAIDEELNKIARVFIDWTADAGANNIHDDNILSSSITQHEGDIDHDALTNYESDEHLPALDEDDLTSDSDTNVATQQSIKAYVDSLIAGVNEFPELTDTPANYTGSAGKFVKVNATPDALLFASIAWADVLKTGSNLTDLATRQHVGLTDVTSDQHHAQVHASEHHVGGGDLVNHDSLTGFVAAEHLSLPNSMANVINSGHTKTIHDSLGLDHGALSGKGDNDHSQYILHSLADVANDFLVASGANTYIRKTLAQTGAILEGDIQHNNLQGYAANRHVVLPGTIATVLTDHDKAAHDALNIDADTLDSLHASSFALTTRKLDDFGTPDDNTDLNATTGRHGLLRKLGGGITNFLRADGTWNAPPSVGVDLFFRAYVGGDQEIGATSTEKVEYQSENYDPDSKFFVGTYEYSPGVAGYYRISASIYTYLDAGKTGILYIYKNGAEYARHRYPADADGFRSISIRSDIYLSAGTDDIAIYYYNGDAAARTIYSGSNQSWFEGTKFG